MDPLAPLVSSLKADGRLRVWSLVITVFGDLVQHRGGQISTARLGPLLARIGIESGALRTALSRLSHDGWVERERSGRFADYRLSATGINRFGPATQKIYAPDRPVDIDDWALGVTLGPDQSRSVQLVPASEISNEADCVVVGRLERLSPAFRLSLMDPKHLDNLRALNRDVAGLKGAELEGIDAAAARLLLIHRWRRIVLRYPDVPAALLPPDVMAGPPRAQVARVYHSLSPETEAWLDRASGEMPAMPAADASFANRFAAANA